MQELLNNILKHAKATEALLQLTLERKKLTVVAADNGIGFDPGEAAKKTKGIGLTSIKNRVQLLDGEMKIASAPEKGTTITIMLKTA